MNRYFAWFGLPGSLVLTLLLSLTALTLALVFQTPDRWLRLAAMLLSSLGDVILMSYTPVTRRLPGPLRGFACGAASFMLAHIAYIAAFGWRIARGGDPLVNAGFWAGVALLALAAVSMTVLFRRSGNRNRGLLALCLAYLAVIGCACAVVFSCAVSEGGWAYLLALGALSFAISDFFIGLEQLGGIDACKDLIWWFYPIGQLLLICP